MEIKSIQCHDPVKFAGLMQTFFTTVPLQNRPPLQLEFIPEVRMVELKCLDEVVMIPIENIAAVYLYREIDRINIEKAKDLNQPTPNIVVKERKKI